MIEVISVKPEQPKSSTVYTYVEDQLKILFVSWLVKRKIVVHELVMWAPLAPPLQGEIHVRSVFCIDLFLE